MNKETLLLSRKTLGHYTLNPTLFVFVLTAKTSVNQVGGLSAHINGNCQTYNRYIEDTNICKYEIYLEPLMSYHIIDTQY